MSTDTERMESAIRRVLAKYPDERAAEGVVPDWHAIHQSLLPADLMAGRGPALRRGLKMLRSSPSAKDLLRLAWLLAAPSHFEARSAAKRIDQVPAEWVTAARHWLDQVAPQSTDP